MTRLVFLGDLHIALGPRWREGQRIHGWICSDIERRAVLGTGPDLIVLGGDVYDASPKPAEIMEAVRLVVRLAGVAPVVIVRGNHDAPQALDVFAHLDAPHEIAVYAEPTVHVFPGGAIAVLPWQDRLGPPADERMPLAEREAAEREDLRTIFEQLGADLRERADGGVRLFAGHLALWGSIPRGARPPGQPEVRGREIEVPLEDLGRVGADGYLLAHVHASRSWMMDEAPVMYAGSVRRTAFGEDEEKRVLLVTATPGSPAVIEPVVLPCAPMLLAETSWSPAGWGVDPAALLAAVQDAAAVAAPGAVPEVRFRYRVASQDSASALAAMATVRQAVEAMGARFVHAAEVIAPKVARCPEIAAAGSLAGKLDVFLTAQKGMSADDPARASAHVALAEIEATLGPSRGSVVAGGVRLRRLRFAGFGIFHEETSLDLDDLPGDLVAICGDNGQGKTTLLSAFPGALSRSIPTAYGSDKLGDYATSDTAFVEAVVDVNGDPVRLYHDLSRGKSYAYLPNGKAVDERGLVSSFDRWAAENLIAPEVRDASLYGVQVSEGIAGLKKGARKAVLLRALGCESYERIAKVARDRETAAQIRLGERVAALESKARDAAFLPSDLEARVAATRMELAATDEAVRSARAGVDAHAAVVRLLADHRALRDRHESAGVALLQLVGRRDAIVATLANAGAIREAAVRCTAIDVELLPIAVEIAGASSRREALSVRAVRAEGAARAARGRAATARRSVDAADAVLLAAPAVEAAVAALPGLREAETRACAAVENARAIEARLRERQGAALDDRLGRLRHGHVEVLKTQHVDTAHGIATAVLGTDDAALATTGSDAIIAACCATHAAETETHRVTKMLRDAEALAGRAGEIKRARAARDAAFAAIAAEETTVAAEEADAVAARLEADGAREADAATVAKAQSLKAEQAALAPVASQAAALDRAEGSLTALVEPIERAEDAVAVAAAALPEGDAPVPPVLPDIRAAETRAREVSTRLAKMERDVETAARLREAVANLEEEREEAAAVVATWRLLAEAFGRAGIQALEIDVACPELSTIATDLLHRYFGPRWTMVIDTRREGASGDDVDALEIRVLDTLKNREDDVLRYSPGERSFLVLAFALALARVVCSRTGATAPTLIRDESGGAVSIENAPSYVAMLRGGAQAIGASKTVLVSHSPAIVSLCDVAIRVTDGRLEVRDPGAAFDVETAA